MSAYWEPWMEEEEKRLLRSYREAMGWCLQYKILVYHPGTGGQMLSLGEMRDAIAAHREQTPPSTFLAHLAEAMERGHR